MPYRKDKAHDRERALTFRHENGHRQARIDHPVPLIAEALAALVAAAGYIVTTDAHAGFDARTDVDARASNARADLTIVDGGKLDAPAKPAAAGSTAPRTDVTGRRAPQMIAVVDANDIAAQRVAAAHGAEGVIATTALIGDFRACIDAVAGGGRWHDASLAGHADTAPAGPALTRRERDVAALVAAGQRNRTIAAALGISEGTVKMHLHNVYAKLGLESRTQLAMDARARG